MLRFRYGRGKAAESVAAVRRASITVVGENNMSRHYPGSTRKTALASALLIALSSPLAFAQTTPPATEDDDDIVTTEAVEVVGSRIKRSTVEGPSPVTVIRAEDIENAGYNTVHDVLETLPQNIGFGQNDFNAAGGFSPNAGVVNLRGLGPGRTLLLINGRRANDYPFPYNGRSNFQ